MPTTPELRRYRTSDHPAVVNLLNQVLPDNQPHNEPAGSVTTKYDFDNQMIVATVEATLCGFIMYGYDGHRGWLYSLAVLPDFRGQGIGADLVRASISALKELGCQKVNLQVRKDNDSVIAFYERLGFSTEPRVSMGMLCP